MVAAVVLLLNAGHEASVNVFGNGLVAMLAPRAAARRRTWRRRVEEMLRFDSALQLFERTATEPTSRSGDVVVEAGQKIAALLGAANRDPAVFDEPDEFDVDRDPNPHLAFGVGRALLPRRAAGPHGAGGVAGARCSTGSPASALAGEPESRGTFVLRGYRRVPVAGDVEGAP